MLIEEFWLEHVPCTNEQHDPANGLIAGFCVRCRTPWPCEWSPERDPATPAAPSAWTCFHCGDTFTNRDEASDHFGRWEGDQPACGIAASEHGILNALRKARDELRRFYEEDTELHRYIHALESKHATELRRQEEAGYAKGLADGQAIATLPGQIDEALSKAGWTFMRPPKPGYLPSRMTTLERVQMVLDSFSELENLRQPRPEPEIDRDLGYNLICPDCQYREHSPGHVSRCPKCASLRLACVKCQSLASKTTTADP